MDPEGSPYRAQTSCLPSSDRLSFFKSMTSQMECLQFASVETEEKTSEDSLRMRRTVVCILIESAHLFWRRQVVKAGGKVARNLGLELLELRFCWLRLLSLSLQISCPSLIKNIHVTVKGCS